MNWRFAKPTTTVFITCSVIIFALFGASISAHAQESEQPAPKFGIKSVDAGGSYFNLTMSPGETQQIQVAVSNTGTAEGEAYLYPADIYTMVNGGMGFHLADEPASGPTLWVEHENTTFSLGPDEQQVETLTISVPEDARPGQHLTSLVVEGTDSSETTESGGVTFKNVMRQAIAVLITIPGPVTPALEIGSTSHRVTSNTSVVAFELTNPGNILLKPAGEFKLMSTDGDELASIPVTLGSFYAGTETQAEIPLDFQLEPGDYTVSLWLEDSAYGVRAESGLLTSTVPVSVPPIPVQVPESVTDPAAEPVVETQIVGIPTWALLVAIPAAIILGALIALGVVLGLRRRSKPAAAPQQDDVTREAPPVERNQAAAVRPMAPPSRKADPEGTPPASQDDVK